MLEEGGYPQRLKNRIRGGKGHLSNTQALELFRNHRASFISHLFLSHLSKNNNHPNIVLDLFTKHAGRVNITVASRYKETALYKITNTMNESPKIKRYSLKKESVQMRLFS